VTPETVVCDASTPLITLNERLARTHGLRCRAEVP